jgi:hypothetical protein
MPHGHCYLWTPGILWGHAVSDAIIALSYFSIPIALLALVRRRKGMIFGSVFILFALFIVACGVGHLIDVWNIWNGAYWLSTVVRVATALASIVTAAVLWPLLPRALAVPSAEDLREQIAERNNAENALREAHEGLEKRVAERTRELEAFTALTLDREDQMISLKQRINELCEQAGRPPEHDLAFVEQTREGG